MAKIEKGNINEWKIVMVKLINGIEPIWYRIVNLYNFNIETIPAYCILDEVISKGLNIINLKCKNNTPVIIDNDGYESIDDVIIIDEFKDDIENIWDWCLRHGEIGNKILNSFDSSKNEESPSDFSIDADEKIYWTCDNKHTIYCGFPTYVSTDGECPICKLEEQGETPSLSYWANLTDNKELLKMYEESSFNDEQSSKISYKSRKKVWLHKDGKELQFSLCDITVKGIEPQFN